MSEGRQIRQQCLTLIQTVGLNFKEADEQQWLVNLGEGQRSELLGYTVSYQQGQLNLDIALSELDELKLDLMETHSTENPQESAHALITGKLCWWGSALRRQDDDQHVLDHISTIGAQHGFRELPVKRFYNVLKSSRHRWQRCLQDAWRAFHARC
jgi:hypothetical protein